MEKYGAACDNLLSAQVVTVDGRQVEAGLKSNPDLFWAIRGGGGNFGVVTALEYQLHPVDQVLSGALTYPPERIPDLLQAFAKFLAAAPDEMDAFAQLLPSEQGRRLKVDVCYCGDPRMGNALLGRCALSSRRMTVSRSCPTWKLRRPGDFLQRRLRTSKQISFFENSAELPLRQLQRRSMMRQPHAR